MVRLRRAYEKVARPDGARRGRETGVPITLYHELDELFRQIQGLQIITGANREAILSAGGGATVGTPPPAPDEPSDPIVQLAPSNGLLLVFEGYNQQARCTINRPFPFRFTKVEIAIDVQSAADSTGDLVLVVGGGRQVLRSSVTYQDLPSTLIDITNLVPDTFFQPNTRVQFGFDRDGPSANTQIQARVNIIEKVTIG
jgi:hypothetical protein